MQPGVDPVGACVGIRGVRIQAIVRELNDEKIDVIEWNTDPSVYIAKALSPARVAGVYLNETLEGAKTATVVVPEDQLSLAIGRDGQNARLAAKLTSWRIDIKSLPEAATDALYKLQEDPEFASIAEDETEITPQIESVLAKKAEGRPVSPEDYQVVTKFVDRVERGVIQQREEAARAELEKQRIEEANVPDEAFEIPLDKFEVSDHVFTIISQVGIDTVGDLLLKLRLEPDEILGLNGMGPKAMQQLKEALEALGYAADEIKEEEPEEPEATVEEETAAETEGEEAEVAAEQPAEAEEEISEVAEAVEEAEAAPEAEEVAEPEAAEAEEEAEVEVAAEVEEEAEAEVGSFEEVLTLEGEDFDIETIEGDEFEEDEVDAKGKKKRKKKKYVEIEYDPDEDFMLVKKKRKRGEDDWDKQW
jgi:N utilization substance protein A